MKRLVVILCIALMSYCAIAQNRTEAKNQTENNHPKKQVLVVGVMHSLPEVLRTSYRSLLRITKEYHPQAIFVAAVPPVDVESWAILAATEGVMAEFWRNHQTLQQVVSSKNTRFTPEDYGRASGYFQFIGDYANAAYYHYRVIGAPKRAVGDEYVDLIFPLAQALGIDSLRSFGTHKFERSYTEAVRGATDQWTQNGNAEAYTKLFAKDYNQSVLPAMFGTYGRIVNTDKALQRANDLHTFAFAPTRSVEVEKVASVCRERDRLLAQRIGRQVEAGSAMRSVVFVESHLVVGVCEALKEKFPQFDVITIDNIEK